MAEHIIDILSEQVSHPKSRGMTSHDLLVSLLVSLTLLGVQVVAFSFVRKLYREIYEPRTYMVLQAMRILSTPSDWWAWVVCTMRESLQDIAHEAGLDAFFFLRYLIFVMAINGVMAVVMVPVLLPLHFTGGDLILRRRWLDRLSISNISMENQSRLTAHLVLCILAVSFCLLVIHRELQHYHRTRAEYMLRHHSIHTSTTLLIKGLYPEFQSVDAIRMFFNDVPGGVSHVWFNRNYDDLDALVRRQQKVAHKLEVSGTWLVKKCNVPREEDDSTPNTLPEIEKRTWMPGMKWNNYLNKVDDTSALEYRLHVLARGKSELSRINAQVYNMQSQADLFPMVNSCFVQFATPVGCFMTYRSIGSSQKTRRNRPGSLFFEKVFPNDVVWTNLSMPTWKEATLHIVATVVDYAVIFGWAVPVALVSMITQVETLSKVFPSMQWLAQFPQVSRMMSSIVSPLALSWLTGQVPRLFRSLARLKGYPTRTLIEMDVQKYLFLFLFVQLFLIVTLATGLPTLIVRMLVNTSEGAITLASSLPKATNFFMSYLIASSFMSSGNILLQMGILIRRSWQNLWTSTPRQRLNSLCHFPLLQWGSVYPLVTNICAISLTYALVSPLILVAAIVGCGVMFVAYKYRILYCYIPRCNAEGDYYPRALFQLFSGLYCMELSLLGTLLLRTMIAHSCVAATLVIGTVIAQHRLSRIFQDMRTRFPLDIDSACSIESIPEESPTISPTVVGTPPEDIKSPEPASPGRSWEMPSHYTVPAAEKVGAFKNEGHKSRSRSEPVSPMKQPAWSSPALSQNGVSASLSTPVAVTTPGSVATPSSAATSKAFDSDELSSLFGSLGLNLNRLGKGSTDQDVPGELFRHPAVRAKRPWVWLPRDSKGIAKDQVDAMRAFPGIQASCVGAALTSDGKIVLRSCPQDFDPYEVMRQ